MNELNLDPSQLDFTDLRFMLILLIIAIIVQKAFKFLSFIKSLKNKNKLNAIIASGITKDTSIGGTLGFEAILLLSLYTYNHIFNKWSFSDTIKSPVVIMYLMIPLINFVTNLGLYYIKVWYLNRVFRTVIR